MRTCRCCGNPLSGQLCDYCGFIEPASSDIQFAESNAVERMVSEHRNSADFYDSMLSHISSISIQAHKYRWNEKTNSFDTLDAIELFDQRLTGKDYYRNVIVSDTEIHQIGVGEKQTFAINYTFAGTPKKARVELVPVQTSKPWQIGLTINDSLQFGLVLGDFNLDPGAPRPAQKSYVTAITDIDFHV